MRGSLRYRLLIGASLSSAIVLTLLGISVYVAMRHAMMNDFELSLQAETRLVSSLIEELRSKIHLEFDSQRLADFLSPKGGRFFEIWQDGKVLARSPSLGELDLPKIEATANRAREIDLPGGRRGLAIALSYSPVPEGPDDEPSADPPLSVFLIVAAEPIAARHTLSVLGWLLTGACAAAVIIMGAILLQVVSRGLQPVNSLAAEIGALTEAGLSRRFARQAVPDELLPVVDKLNGLLQRLENAFAREKSFTADVAHELRTPLAGLRITMEVCRSQPRRSMAYESAIDECRGIVDRMGTMVESLLLLARTDSGHLPIVRKQIDLRPLISEIWCQFEEQVEAKNAAVSFDLADENFVETDSEKLGIVLRNLFDNAVSYVDQGGHIRIATRREEDNAIVEVVNTGSQIAAEDTPRLFERFWRGDVARTDVGTHCGLGLSLCKRLMTLLDGEISVKTAKSGEFVCQLKMKRSNPSPASASASTAALVL